MGNIRGKLRGQETGDVWGVWANRLARRARLVSKQMWTIHCRLKCIFWQINLGSKCRFWGKMHFRRLPHSTITIGDNCRFRSATWSNMVGINRPCMVCTLRPSAKIEIGTGSGFSGTVISAANSIMIGKNLLCGANVTITDTDWHHKNRSKEGIEDAPSAPVVIGNNVWLGMNVIVLKGVTIGDGSVIAPNSVVTRDIGDNMLAGGQPAKEIRGL